ncbi:MAG: nuclear transport factor 2 family protein [Candidatus Rokubacteria bacterium]|nr:nuclear transport factor 2 family protein [Candidatus Rokubacteria bacterium]
MIDGLDHLVLTVRSIAATCDFYRRALGMEVVTFGEGRTALRFGDQKINLHEAGRERDPRAAKPTPGSGDLCLRTRTPVADWAKRLSAAGVAIELGPVPRTGARGALESIYLRDPDDNLIEISNEVEQPDPIAPLRAWLTAWQERVRAVDFAGGRALCAPDVFGFGTYAEFVDGLDAVEAGQWRHIWSTIRDFTIDAERARGAIAGDRAWVAAMWTSRGTRPDGSTFPRPGRCTVAFERRDGRWLAVHTHFSLTPSA